MMRSPLLSKFKLTICANEKVEMISASSESGKGERGTSSSHHLCGVPEQSVQALPRLHVPQPRRIVHRSRGHHCAVRVEGQANDLGGVPAVRVVQIAVFRVPEFARFVCQQKKRKSSVGHLSQRNS